MCCRTKLEANETHANSKWIIKQMNTIKEAGHDRLLYSVSTRPRLVMSLDFKISRSNEFASIVRVCSPASSSLYPPLIILMHTFLSCLRCRVFLNMSFKKKRQVCRHCVSVGGSHGEATGQQSGTCLHFMIHTVKQRSLHLFKTLLMSFNTASRLPLLPPCVCLLADNASGHFVLHCNTLPVNFQRNARLTLLRITDAFGLPL